jgi:hypothetical protein
MAQTGSATTTDASEVDVFTTSGRNATLEIINPAGSGAGLLSIDGGGTWPFVIPAGPSSAVRSISSMIESGAKVQVKRSTATNIAAVQVSVY